MKVKYEIDQGLVMINLYEKFSVHSRYVKQVIVIKERRMDGRTSDDNRQNFGRWRKNLFPLHNRQTYLDF